MSTSSPDWKACHFRTSVGANGGYADDAKALRPTPPGPPFTRGGKGQAHASLALKRAQRKHLFPATDGRETDTRCQRRACPPALAPPFRTSVGASGGYADDAKIPRAFPLLSPPCEGGARGGGPGSVEFTREDCLSRSIDEVDGVSASSPDWKACHFRTSVGANGGYADDAKIPRAFPLVSPPCEGGARRGGPGSVEFTREDCLARLIDEADGVSAFLAGPEGVSFPDVRRGEWRVH